MPKMNPTPPPTGLGGGNRLASRGRPVVKPKDLKGSLSRLFKLISAKRRGLIPIFVLAALSSASAMLSPLLIGLVISAINSGDLAEQLILLLFGLYLSDWFVRFMQQYLMAAIGQGIIHDIRSALFNKMKDLPLVFFDKHLHGELMSRLTNDIDNISSTLSSSLTQLLSYFFTLSGILIIMISLSSLLTAVALVSVVLIFTLTSLITKRTRKLYSAQQRILGDLNGQIEESISGLHLVKAFCLEDEMIRDFEEKNEALRKVASEALIWSGYLMPMTNVINNLNHVAITVVSSILALRSQLSIGMITSFLLYSRQFSRPFVEIAQIYNNFQSAVAGAERVFEILDEIPEPPDQPDSLSLEAVRGEFELDHVSFSYRPDQSVLRDISLKIPQGSKVAIVGPTGAGKTTLINLLARFYDVSSGRILLDGHDLREYRLRDLRSSFGIVLQDSALFAVSIRENLCYGRSEIPFERVVEASEITGADSFIRQLPQRYETILSQGGAELSQGERQLLTISRALLGDAPILILDEATSSVDTVTEQKIRATLLRISTGRTSFIIAHRLSTIMDSDLILFIDDGQILEKGTHSELIHLGGRYAAMYLAQCPED